MLTEEQEQGIAERVERIEEVSEHYLGDGGTCDTNPDFVTDVLADLMHYCDKFPGIDFNNHLRIARGHYDAEVAGID